MTIPNFLTFLRIGLIPLLVFMLYLDTGIAKKAAVLIFIVACLTDFFDGYIARKWNQESYFGKVLDPLADKLLIASILLFLAGFHRLSTWGILPACIIVCREILISGMRESLNQKGIQLPVIRLAKFKTATQMIAISLLLLGDATPFQGINCIGEIILWAAALLTLVTGYQYIAYLFPK